MESRTRHYAHSTERQDRSDWQPFVEHLEGVAKLGMFAWNGSPPQVRLSRTGEVGDAG
jgi:hypothetical protein